MGINRWFCINSSGRTYGIYDVDRNGAKVGDLYPREAFIVYGSEGCLTSIQTADKGKSAVIFFCKITHKSSAKSIEIWYNKSIEKPHKKRDFNA